MPILLAFAAAALWGVSTFLVAHTARTAPAIPLTFWSQTLGLVLLLPAVVALDGFHADLANTGLGVIAGLGAGTSLAMLYASLRLVAVGIAASISGGVGTVGPVVYSILTGTPPSFLALVGIAITVVAVAALLVLPAQEDQGAAPARAAPALPESAAVTTRGLGRGTRGRLVGSTVAAASGLAMTVYYVALAQIGDDAGLWTAIDSRLGSALTMLVLCLVMMRGLRMTYPDMVAAAWVGVTGACGAAAFILSIGAGGSLGVIVPIAVLSPAVSVLLARLLLQQRMTGLQVVALLAAGAGVVAVVSG